MCGCQLDGVIIATVEANRVVELEATFNDGVGGDISAITVDQMFDDLDQILASPDGYVMEGAKYRGLSNTTKVRATRIGLASRSTSWSRHPRTPFSTK